MQQKNWDFMTANDRVSISVRDDYKKWTYDSGLQSILSINVKISFEDKKKTKKYS